MPEQIGQLNNLDLDEINEKLRIINRVLNGEIVLQKINVTHYATITNFNDGSIGSIDVNETNLTFGGIVIDGENKKITINDTDWASKGIQLEYNDGSPRGYLGDGANQNFKFDGVNVSWKGTNTSLTAAGAFTASNATITGSITATTGVIGGWTIAATTLASSNITIDSGNDKITVNTLTIDGANDRIRSANYVSGYAGAGFTLEPDLFEVGNIAARGIIRTSVFQKDIISAIGGNLWVRPADVLATNMTAADASTLTIEGNETFSVGDFLRIKDGTNDEWMEVTNVGSAPTYTVTRDKDSQYGADANPVWKKGASVVNFGVSGAGGVYLTASETNAPYMSVYTQGATPWDGLTTQVRVGNLNGSYGISADKFGLAAGDSTLSDHHIIINGTDGTITVKGSITITGGSGIASLSDAGDMAVADDVAVGDLQGGVTDRMFTSSTEQTNIEGWIKAGDVTKIDGGDISTGSVTAAKITVTDLAALNANLGAITAGTLSSSDWAASAGIRLDLNNKWLKMGGSNVTAAGAANGMFLGLDTSYKFYCGDGSGKYVKYDGTDIALAGGAVTIGSGKSLVFTGTNYDVEFSLVSDDSLDDDADVEFTSLSPGTLYKLTYSLKVEAADGDDYLKMQFNSDSGANHHGGLHFSGLESGGGFHDISAYVSSGFIQSSGLYLYHTGEITFSTAPGDNTLVLFEWKNNSCDTVGPYFQHEVANGYYDGASNLTSIKLWAGNDNITGKAFLQRLT